MILRPKTEEEWLAERQKRIGASEWAVVLGIDPFQSPYQLHQRKTGKLEAKEPTLRMRKGRHDEQFIADEYERVTGLTLEDPGPYTMWTPTEHYLAATPDRLRTHEDGTQVTVQIKSTSRFMSDKWENGPPLYVQAQIQAEMYCMGIDHGEIFALIDDSKYSGPHPVERNEKWLLWALPQLADFWRRVQEDDPPPPTTEDDLKAWEKLHPSQSGMVVALPEDLLPDCVRREELKSEITVLDAHLRDIDRRIKLAIGDAELGTCGGFGFAYKTIERQAYEVKASTYRTLRAVKIKD